MRSPICIGVNTNTEHFISSPRSFILGNQSLFQGGADEVLSVSFIKITFEKLPWKLFRAIQLSNHNQTFFENVFEGSGGLN